MAKTPLTRHRSLSESEDIMSESTETIHQIVAITYSKETNYGEFSPPSVLFEGTQEECEDKLSAIEEYVNGAGGFPNGTEVDIRPKHT